MKYVCKGQPGQRHPISQLPPPLSAQDKNGKATDWGNVPYSKVYGPQGWCEADNPVGEGRCDHWMGGGGAERSRMLGQCKADNPVGKGRCDRIRTPRSSEGFQV